MPEATTAPSRASVPFRQFVLKLHSRCDLACDHCYVYEHQDTSWRRRPPVVSPEVLRRSAERIAEHAREHRLDRVTVVLHGGEPLLAGPRRIREAAEALRGALAGTAALDLRMQTNGVRLDERFCELFAEYDIRVGVSLDGDRYANDLHRRFRDGRSSHDLVLRGLRLLDRPRYRRQYAGLLCTIDLRADPLAAYEALRAARPPRIDFLLPHATWEHPPPRPPGAAAPYAEWLLRVFDRWDADGRPMRVRIFESVLSTLAGGPATTEALGVEPVDLLVIETDGSLEQADSLKTAYDGAPATGFDVFTHRLDEVAAHPGVTERQLGLAGLAPQCRACPVVASCGGGLYAHRWRADGSGFANPSVYCADLLALVTGIRERVARRAPEPVTAVREERDGVTLDGDAVAELAGGRGGAAVVRALRGRQLALRRELLALLMADGDAPGEVTALLAELDARAPEALDAVTAHPYTRAWAVRALDEPPEARAAGLAELAAAAVLRAGWREPVRVPLRGGVLRLPGAGRLLLDPSAGEALVVPDAEGFTAAGAVVRREGPSDPRWQPVRRVRSGRWAAALEDTDPYRDCHGWPVAERLDAAAYGAWARLLPDAWRLLDAELPEYADGLAEGLAAITPLRPAPHGEERSSTARDAFGAVGVALPGAEDPAEALALLLAHEFQHVTLGALLDEADLVDPDDPRRITVAWRPDPRPPEGVLQGVYAHAAVVDFWRARAVTLAGTPRGAGAAAEAQRWLRATEAAATDLVASGALTAEGERFVATLLDRLLTPAQDASPVAATDGF